MDHELIINQQQEYSNKGTIIQKVDSLLLKNNDDSFFLDVEMDAKISKEDLLKNFEQKRKIGHIYSFFYKDGEPLIVIGPHCISI